MRNVTPLSVVTPGRSGSILGGLLPSLLQNANGGGRGKPELQPVAILSVETVFGECVESAVRDPNPIGAWRNLDAHRIREVIRATGDHDPSRRNVQAGFNNVIPFRGVIVRLLRENVHGDWNIHVSYRADTDRSGSQRQQSVYRLIIPGLRKVAGYSFILDVEMEVISKQ